MLHNNGFEFVPIGIKKGNIFGKDILNIRMRPEISDVHTVTLYINPYHQMEWYEYILRLHPKRIIFNPGTENPELKKMAENQGITAIYACTLVLISTGQF